MPVFTAPAASKPCISTIIVGISQFIKIGQIFIEIYRRPIGNRIDFNEGAFRGTHFMKGGVIVHTK